MKGKVNKMSNKVILFDWGGVIESHDDSEYSLNNALRDFLTKVNPEYSSKYFNHPCYKTQDDKDLSITNNSNIINEWALYIKDTFQSNMSINEIITIYNETLNKIDYYKDIVAYATNLKNKCLIGILSNLTAMDKSRLDMQVNLSDFDYVGLSYILGISKPNPKIYEVVTQQLATEPSNILFIDDTPANITAASQYGWQTCLATGKNLDKIKESVDNFLEH